MGKATRNFRSGAILAMACAAGLVVAGCGLRSTQVALPYTVEDVDGNVQLSTSRFVLIIEGVTYGGKTEASMMVAGRGISTSTTSSNSKGFEMRTSYRGKGVCEIVIGQVRVQVTNDGGTLVASGKSYDLSQERPVLLFKQDGSVERVESAAE